MRTEQDWDDLHTQYWATVAEYEKLRARLAEIEKFLNECKKEDLDRYATGDLNGNVCEGRLQLADDLLSVVVGPDTAHVATLRARLDAAENRLEASTDWYQQRFNRLRTWVEDEVRPLSSDVARRYYAICANGSPAPHESADWTDTMHALRLRAEQAERKVAENAARLAAAETLIRYIMQLVSMSGFGVAIPPTPENMPMINLLDDLGWGNPLVVKEPKK